MSLNKVNFNEGENCGNDKDVQRETVPKAVGTKKGTEVKCVANSSSTTGQSERDLDFSVLNKSQQIKEPIQSEGTEVKGRTVFDVTGNQLRMLDPSKGKLFRES